MWAGTSIFLGNLSKSQYGTTATFSGIASWDSNFEMSSEIPVKVFFQMTSALKHILKDGKVSGIAQACNQTVSCLYHATNLCNPSSTRQPRAIFKGYNVRGFCGQFFLFLKLFFSLLLLYVT